MAGLSDAARLVKGRRERETGSERERGMGSERDRAVGERVTG